MQWWGAAVVLAALILASLAQVGNGSAASDPRAAAGSSCVRPYSDSSPWNTAIGGDPAYAAARSRPVTKVKVLEAISEIRRGGAALSNRKSGTLRIPLPKGARATTQTGQLIVVDPKSGEEWGVFGLGRQGRAWTALFGYKFSTKTDGVPAIGKDGGGLAARAGASYLAGLVRACEIANGKIDHAFALAFDSASIAHITPLRELGIGISLDDFGTRHSSLAHLQRLPVDQLKIDRSFVINMANNEKDAFIVRSTVTLGRDLGLRIVAEGVEDDLSAGLLEKLGCDFAQGRLISDALPSDELIRWLLGHVDEKDAASVAARSGVSDHAQPQAGSLEPAPVTETPGEELVVPTESAAEAVSAFAAVSHEHDEAAA